MRSDARRRGDRQGHTRSHICEKSLMPLAPLPPRPVPSQDLKHQGKLAHGFTWGAIPHNRKPRFQNSKYVMQILRSLPCINRAL
jgi:hypothetical protein